MSMTAAKAEFWGDFQVDLFTRNTAIYLANQSQESLISTNGYKVHRPILSNPLLGTYTPYSDISYGQKSAEDQTLSVDTYKYAADQIDDTDENQTEYDLVAHSSKSIRMGLMNQIEQEFADEFTNAGHSINNGSAVIVDTTNVVDLFTQASGILGSFDAPQETSMRAAAFGPQTVAKLRAAKAGRETGLGDSTLMNGVVGAYDGFTVVENNNLPWSGQLDLATNPTDGDTVTIAGVTFTFKATPTAAGHVDIGGSATVSCSNLEAAIEGGSGAGTTYIELSARDRFMLTRKRAVAASVNTTTISLTGYGDIAVSETLTAAADGFSNLRQTSIFMIRGAIDVVVQMMKLEIMRDPDTFGDLVRGMVGLGTKTFDDGATLMVKMNQDVSSFV